MINSLFGPITYTTDVNSVIDKYYHGGFSPRTFLIPMTPQIRSWNNPVPTSQNYNPLQFLFDVTNPVQKINSFFTPPINYTPMNFNYTIVENSYTDAIKNSKSSLFSTKKVTAQAGGKTNSSKSAGNSNQIVGQNFVANAKKYLGTTEANNGHLKFIINSECHSMDPYNEEWCTDFVTYVVKETYKQNGKTAPLWFGSHDVATLKRQAELHSKFYNTKTKHNKPEYITKNIKSGDIMILNENGASHTGFVTKIYNDGSFDTIEGNVGDPGGQGYGKVKTNYYQAQDSRLSGFIRLV